MAARAIKVGDAQLAIAGGVESMSRAPFVMPKPEKAFIRSNDVYDTTIGWRFINETMRERYGFDSMPETDENIAEDFSISRQDQYAFALTSRQKTAAAQSVGVFHSEIIPVKVPKVRKGRKVGGFDIVDAEEQPRPESTLEGLAALPTPFRTHGSVTAGNASGVNDGACTVLLASEMIAKANGLTPRAEVVATVAVGVEPRIMGIGPGPATEKILAQTGLS